MVNDMYQITFGRAPFGEGTIQNYSYPTCPKCGKPYIYIGDPIGSISQYVCVCGGMTQPLPIPNYSPPALLQGWICPRCKKVNAPFVAACDCKE